MGTKITCTDIVQCLHRLGVKPGMMLEVHCSLSRFGHVTGGAEAVIEALMKTVGEQGAIVMPSFRLSPNLPLTEEDLRMGLVTKIRILPAQEEHTAMGVVADTFRLRPDVVTGEGLFRVSAWGRDAAVHAQGFQHLIDHEGFALQLGVDIYRLSAMHYVEDALPQAIRDRFRPSDEARAVYPEEDWLIESWIPEKKPWYEIQEEAYRLGLIRDTAIGDATCLFLPVKPVIELYRRALLERPFELYGM
ncbi:MAG: AAC(3) family N-acetyltransferase [Clostridiaceae bacterium]|nr:AAC(3) family N-acetyltransferase [Clostridiaceae bacterium]